MVYCLLWVAHKAIMYSYKTGISSMLDEEKAILLDETKSLEEKLSAIFDLKNPWKEKGRAFVTVFATDERGVSRSGSMWVDQEKLSGREHSLSRSAFFPYPLHLTLKETVSSEYDSAKKLIGFVV